ncbi:hypothetical protein HDV00_009679 [Rhizophlyctis rosea]|nr:hypothetical protein HDV00_009679 [Rhizophlyctis rosea]
MYLYRARKNLFGREKLLSIRHPDCPIYQQMRKDIAIEDLANKNTSEWQTFNMLCEYANIGIRPMEDTTAIVKNTAFLDHLAEKVDLVFSWNRIADITDPFIFEEKLYKSYSNRATLDDRLEIAKYIFRHKFPHDACESDLEVVWRKKKDFIDNVYTLVQDGDHMVNKIFKENNITLDHYHLPESMETSIPLEAIRANFHFDASVKNLKSGLVAQVLNAFFGMKVYGIKVEKEEEDEQEGKKRKRKQVSTGGRGKNKRRYLYQASPDYALLMEICLPYCEEKRDSYYKGPREPEPSFLLKDVEDELVSVEPIMPDENLTELAARLASIPYGSIEWNHKWREIVEEVHEKYRWQKNLRIRGEMVGAELERLEPERVFHAESVAHQNPFECLTCKKLKEPEEKACISCGQVVWARPASESFRAEFITCH